jgi:hypothetical protein
MTPQRSFSAAFCGGVLRRKFLFGYAQKFRIALFFRRKIRT